MRKIVLAAALGLLVSAGTAHAGAIIIDGNVILGVDDLGQLNVANGTGGVIVPTSSGGTSPIGLRYRPFNNEATSPGCLCEGWGVGIADGVGNPIGGGAGVDRGFANNAAGIAGLALSSFVSTASTATSVVTMGQLVITHDFALAATTNDLFQVHVSITNGGPDIAQLLYRRVMDWDVDPTTFNEFSTIGGTAAAVNVVRATDDGFESSDPFSANTPIVGGAVGDFVDVGPTDHGAAFDFDFGALLSGETLEFDIFYGGSLTEFGAFTALNAVGAEVYSFGQPSNDPLGLGLPLASGLPTNTFIFGFAGVGGVIVEPIPEPGTMALFGLGTLGLLGIVRRRRRKQNVTETA